MEMVKIIINYLIIYFLKNNKYLIKFSNKLIKLINIKIIFNLSKNIIFKLFIISKIIINKLKYFNKIKLI